MCLIHGHSEVCPCPPCWLLQPCPLPQGPGSRATREAPRGDFITGTSPSARPGALQLDASPSALCSCPDQAPASGNGDKLFSWAQFLKILRHPFHECDCCFCSAWPLDFRVTESESDANSEITAGFWKQPQANVNTEACLLGAGPGTVRVDQGATCWPGPLVFLLPHVQAWERSWPTAHSWGHPGGSLQSLARLGASSRASVYAHLKSGEEGLCGQDTV